MNTRSTGSTEEKPDPHGQSFGAFKPVGYVVIAFDSDARAAEACKAMRDAGFAAGDIEQIRAADHAAHMAHLTDSASGTAEFGHEIVLMRRYRELAEQGRGWLLVRAPDDDAAARITDVAKRFDAKLAERYHSLAVEDLI
jgi:hypothetical protein